MDLFEQRSCLVETSHGLIEHRQVVYQGEGLGVVLAQDAALVFEHRQVGILRLDQPTGAAQQPSELVASDQGLRVVLAEELGLETKEITALRQSGIVA
jgi:hypothetical protein